MITMIPSVFDCIFFLVTNCYHVLFVGINWRKLLLGLILERLLWLTDCLWQLPLFYIHYFWLISIIYLKSIFFELFIIFIILFLGQGFHTTITFTWWIVGTRSLLIITTFVVYLIPKQWRCLFRTNFSTSGKISSFVLLLGLTGSWIVYFLVINVSEGFFIFLL